MQKLTKSFQYGDHEVTIETGQIARQASGAVKVTMGDTVVLVTAVGRKTADPGRPFFPLTVNYQEKFYAAGRIPGGFFKREGRPTEKETLTCRLIDRPIRPLFPKGFMNEVQVIATLMSTLNTQPVGLRRVQLPLRSYSTGSFSPLTSRGIRILPPFAAG